MEFEDDELAEPWACENCGEDMLPGHKIQHTAYGYVDEDGSFQMGDHFYMHINCDDPTKDE